MVRTYRIALLLCDVPLPPVKEVFGDYLNVFETWLRGSLAAHPDPAVREGVQVVVDGYDVVERQEYPSLERLKGGNDAYDAIMISGSRHTAHELDPPFIPKLIDWVRNIAMDPQFLYLKLVGICFGHQIIALAMGGTSERGVKGWEVGVYGAALTEEGRKWFAGPLDGLHETKKIYLEQMHRDHVPVPPPGFVVTLKTDKYPVQGMVKYHPSSTPEIPIAQIFTVQGHPEFPPELVQMMVDYRIKGGIFTEDDGMEALRRVWGKDKEGGEGLVRVGWSMWNVMLTQEHA